jgi:hypothetical protein
MYTSFTLPPWNITLPSPVKQCCNPHSNPLAIVKVTAGAIRNLAPVCSYIGLVIVKSLPIKYVPEGK